MDRFSAYGWGAAEARNGCRPVGRWREDYESMRCATCGEQLLRGEDRCPTCGAAVVRRPVPASLATRGQAMSALRSPGRRNSLLPQAPARGASRRRELPDLRSRGVGLLRLAPQEPGLSGLWPRLGAFPRAGRHRQSGTAAAGAAESTGISAGAHRPSAPERHGPESLRRGAGGDRAAVDRRRRRRRVRSRGRRCGLDLRYGWIGDVPVGLVRRFSGAVRR